MTTYTTQDLAEGWEFKILRSSTGAFRNPEHLRAVLDEEGCGGWVLVEKFDNSRLRLKRPATARERDASLGFDPYRTQVGMSEGALALLIVGGVLSVILLLLLIVFIAKA